MLRIQCDVCNKVLRENHTSLAPTYFIERKYYSDEPVSLAQTPTMHICADCLKFVKELKLHHDL